MNLKILSFLASGLFLLPSIASSRPLFFPKKFEGLCQEVGTSKKQKSQIGIDFNDFPNAVELIQADGSRQRAILDQPTRISAGADRYVILEKVSTLATTDFTLRYYGTIYAEGPYFYEMSVDYSLDANDQLTTHQLQTTYYQGKVSVGNEWLCNYGRY